MTKTDSSDCNKCGGTLYIIDGVYYDQDQMRAARYCAECHTLFGCYAHGLSVQKEGIDMSELSHQNKLMRDTLRVILSLYPQSPEKGQAMPQTRAFWEKRALMDQNLILVQRTKISSLRRQVNMYKSKLEALQSSLRRVRAFAQTKRR